MSTEHNSLADSKGTGRARTFDWGTSSHSTRFYWFKVSSNTLDGTVNCTPNDLLSNRPLFFPSSHLSLLSTAAHQTPHTSVNEAQTRTLPYYSSATVLSVQKPPQRASLKSHQVETTKNFISPFTLLPNQHKGIWSLMVLTLTGKELLIIYEVIILAKSPGWRARHFRVSPSSHISSQEWSHTAHINSELWWTRRRLSSPQAISSAHSTWMRHASRQETSTAQTHKRWLMNLNNCPILIELLLVRYFKVTLLYNLNKKKCTFLK